MISITVSDNADGTGGVATIAGAGVASTVTVYRSPWTGSMTSYSFSSVGSRTGNGVVSATGQGYYLWQAVEDTGSGLVISNAFYQNLTDATDDSVLYSILEAFRLRIISLGLDGIADASIYTSWVFRSIENIDPDPPAVVIAPYGSVSYPGKMTSTDDIAYTVAVALVDSQQQNATKNLQRNTKWWESVSRAFRSQRLPGVDRVYRVDPSSQPVVDPAAWAKNYLVMPMSWQVTARETRGIP